MGFALTLRSGIGLAFLALEVVVFLLLLTALRRSRKTTLYASSNAALLGGVLFSSFTVLLTAGLLLSYGSLSEEALDGLTAELAGLTQTFVYALLPFCALFFFAVSVSNILLISREGFSARHMLGIFAGVFFVGAGVVVMFIGSQLRTVAVSAAEAGDTVLAAVALAVPWFFASLLGYAECLLCGVIYYTVLAGAYKPAYNKSVIVVLGCAVLPSGEPCRLLRTRLERAARFARRQELKTGRRPRFLVSGGKGTDTRLSEAECMKRTLVSLGVPEEDITLEDRSTTTEENMRFCKPLLDKLAPDGNVVFATSNYHVFRSGILARREGLTIEGMGSPTGLYYWPNEFMRELAALLYDRRMTHLAAAAVLAVLSAAAGVAGVAGLL